MTGTPPKKKEKWEPGGETEGGQRRGKPKGPEMEHRKDLEMAKTLEINNGNNRRVGSVRGLNMIAERDLGKKMTPKYRERPFRKHR